MRSIDVAHKPRQALAPSSITVIQNSMARSRSLPNMTMRKDTEKYTLWRANIETPKTKHTWDDLGWKGPTCHNISIVYFWVDEADYKQINAIIIIIGYLLGRKTEEFYDRK